MLDFCKHVVAPTHPDMHESVAARVDPSLLSLDAPVMTAKEVEEKFGPEDVEAQQVINEINSRKPIYCTTNDLELEEVEGFKVRCVRGELGLIRIEER